MSPIEHVVTVLGETALAVALPVAAYVAAALGLGLWRRGAAGRGGGLLQSGRRAVVALAALVTLAIACLWYGFLSDDFRLQYVAEHSARTLPLLYKFTALWGGNEGSLLFWCFILCIWMVVAARTSDPEAAPLVPYATAILGVVAVFFLYLLNFVARPFALAALPPSDGSGLDTLLQDPYMAIHPPMLYTGFVGFAVPFAFAMAALLARSRGVAWIRVTRRWALLAFFFLGTGILLGAHWAYHELGWGGYWGWDPVENASLLPWLTGTAFIHSSLVDERRGMLKFWDLLLVSVTFLLTLFGAFLTRSGIVNSVHTFANSGLGPYFMAFIGVAAVGAAWLILDRWELLRNEREVESLVSKEAAFLFNNVLFLGAAFAVLWGTIFPLITQALEGAQIAVGPPFYNRVMVPVGVLLVLLMGVAPLLAWRKAAPGQLLRTLLGPLGCGAGYLLVAAAAGVRQPGALIATTVAVFAIASVVVDAAGALRVRAQITGDPFLRNALRLFSRNRQRYGGYLVHVAVALMVIGFAGSTAYASQEQVALRPGQAVTFHGYTLRYSGLQERDYPDRQVIFAPLQLSAHGRPLGTIQPGDVLFGGSDVTPRIQVGLRSTLEEDLYVVLAGEDRSGLATFIIHVNPLVAWIWIGQALFMLGTLWALWPERGRAALRHGRLAPAVPAVAASGRTRPAVVAAVGLGPGAPAGGGDGA